MIPPTPPPIKQVADATPRFECEVMLFAWYASTPGMQNCRNPTPDDVWLVGNRSNVGYASLPRKTPKYLAASDLAYAVTNIPAAVSN